MKGNVGGADRIVRILIGIVLLAAVFLVEGPFRWAGAIGVVPLFTGIFGYCPLYAIFGLSTCPLTQKHP